MCLAIFHERGWSSIPAGWKVGGKSWLLPLPPLNFGSHIIYLPRWCLPTANFSPEGRGGEISGGRPFWRGLLLTFLSPLPVQRKTASVSVSRILADEETRRSPLLESTFPPSWPTITIATSVDGYSGNLHGGRGEERGGGGRGGGSSLPSSRKFELRDSSKCSGIRFRMREYLRDLGEHCFRKESIVFLALD